MNIDESTVRQRLDKLAKQGLVNDKSGFGSRVTRYRHRFCNTEFGALRFSDQELAVVCVFLVSLLLILVRLWQV
jgi:uncharacterized protein YceH (UPF0502 family)